MTRTDGEYSRDAIPGRLDMAVRDRQRVVDAARSFRRTPTRSERLLWAELRAGKLGVKFRRQHPIGPLVVDFCCPAQRLIVEVDGPIHDPQQERDVARQRLLEDRGYRILRVSADEVECHLPQVLQRITSAVHTPVAQFPPPDWERGRE